ncbi:hypothetical protein PV773_24490 [Mesorhizobium sp. CC13]|uniref:hypothetical protein n=1 Tax=Mesorhizobium sp. CC13 TaxID=3029194 RepID=UPI003263BEC8
MAINAIDFETMRGAMRKLANGRQLEPPALRILAQQIIADLCPGQPAPEEMIEALIAAAEEAIASPDAA